MNEAPESEPVPTVASGERAGDVIDRYRSIAEFRAGGMVSVWSAHQSQPMKRDVALRIFSSSAVRAH